MRISIRCGAGPCSIRMVTADNRRSPAYRDAGSFSAAAAALRRDTSGSFGQFGASAARAPLWRWKVDFRRNDQGRPLAIIDAGIVHALGAQPLHQLVDDILLKVLSSSSSCASAMVLCASIKPSPQAATRNGLRRKLDLRCGPWKWCERPILSSEGCRYWPDRKTVLAEVTAYRP